MTASNESFHYLVSPLPENQGFRTDTWLSRPLKTAYYDEPLCAEWRFFTPHPVTKLDRGEGLESYVIRLSPLTGDATMQLPDITQKTDSSYLSAIRETSRWQRSFNN